MYQVATCREGVALSSMKGSDPEELRDG